jgi:hypothetical protein
MSKENPNYYSILTAEIRYDKRLTPLQKLLYSEITALSNKTGECWATNNYFAELYGVSETWISLSIKKLVSLNYLELRFEEEDGTRRYIKLFNSSYEGLELELKGGLTEVNAGGLTTVKTNNINSNNKKNNIDKSKKEPQPKHFLTDKEIEWLSNLDDETINHIVKNYNCNAQQIKDFGLEVIDSCKIHGYKYSDYKAVLIKWVRDRYGKRLSDRELKQKELEEIRKEYPGLEIVGGGYDGL